MSSTFDKRYSGAAYAECFAEVRAELPGRGLAWLDERRARAIARFAEEGFPSPRVEAFKYTNLAPLSRTVYRPAPRRANGVALGDFAHLLVAGADAHRLVFVDGYYRADLSQPGALESGIEVTTLAAALEADPGALERHFAATAEDSAGEASAALVDLNTALMTDGAVIRLADGAQLEAPIHLLFLAGPGEGPRAHVVRNLILAGAGSRVTVLESHAGAAGQAYWGHAVTEVVLGISARVRHYKLQREGPEAMHVAATEVRLAADAIYESFVLATGGRLARNEISVILDGEGSDCRLGGAILGRGRQLLDATTWIDHAKPGATSREIYKSVLDDDAHGVFQGKITVRPDAQRSDAHQSSKNLLLSTGAQVDTKPELEIFADDVKCTHGATIGQLDADAMFYLKSRGIDEVAARGVLLFAFAQASLDQVTPEPLRDRLQEILHDLLPGGHLLRETT